MINLFVLVPQYLSLQEQLLSFETVIIKEFENYRIQFLMPRALDDNIHINFLAPHDDGHEFLTSVVGLRRYQREKFMPANFRVGWSNDGKSGKNKIMMNGPHGLVLMGSVDFIYLYINDVIFCTIDNRDFYMARKKYVINDYSLRPDFHDIF